MFLEQFRSERSIQRGWVRPTEHLLLSTGIVEALEEFAKPVDEVAFCEQDKNGETHVQLTLNHPELPCNFAGLPLHFLWRIADKALDRDRKEESVYRTIGSILFEQAQELFPLAGRTRFNLLKHQAASGIQDHRIICEPPVHVDGSTDALKFIL